MRPPRSFLATTLLLAVLGATAACVPVLLAPPPFMAVEHPEPGPPAEYEPFAKPLDPYGRWFVYGTYGWVWTPTVVASDWRPYTVGRWIWSDAGWTWVSDEPWGWATFHYGRWFYDGTFGWIWVPGSEWGPSWVCWRSGAAFVGWAPLPPGVVTVTVGRCDPWIGGWVFVEDPWFLEPHLGFHVVPAIRNTWVHPRTETRTTTSTWREPVTGTTRTGFAGPDISTIERRSGSIPRRKLDTVIAQEHAEDHAQDRAPQAGSDADPVKIRVADIERELPSSRVPASKGAGRLDTAPTGGQHRPEVDSDTPVIRPIPADKRGSKVPVKQAPRRDKDSSPKRDDKRDDKQDRPARNPDR